MKNKILFLMIFNIKLILMIANIQNLKFKSMINYNNVTTRLNIFMEKTFLLIASIVFIQFKKKKYGCTKRTSNAVNKSSFNSFYSHKAKI